MSVRAISSTTKDIRRAGCAVAKLKNPAHGTRGLLRILAVLLVATNVVFADTPQTDLPPTGLSSGSDILQGKRLFFDIQSRVPNAKVLQETVQGNAPIKSVAKNALSVKSVEAGRLAEADNILRNVRQHTLRYDAFIASANGVSIIVNGMLCDKLSYNRKVLQDTEGYIVLCPLLKRQDLRLVLQEDSMSIHVMQNLQLLGVVLPGQSL